MSDKPAMRRADRALSLEDTEQILREAEYGVFSLSGEDGAPYGVPLSYIYRQGAIYFHCAHEGRKADCMRRDPRAAFVAVASQTAVYNGNFTVRYRSAMASGAVEPVCDDVEKRAVLIALCEKYLPGDADKAASGIDRAIPFTAVWKLKPQWITGKANRAEAV